jgi:TrmH family RNA methyltransferase
MAGSSTVVQLGRHHPLLARLRSLRRDPGLRESEGLFAAEGVHLAHEALAAGAEIDTVVVSPRLAASVPGQRLLQALLATGRPCFEVGDTVMDSIQDARSPQPILMLIRRPPLEGRAVLERAAAAPLVLVTHGIQDPGNLGSILRTADAAGVDVALICGGADPYHTRAVRGSAGGIFRLRLGRPDEKELDGLLDGRPMRRLAATPAGGTPHTEADLTGPCALFLGSEARGLPQEWLVRADGRISIPMRRGVESLSVVAAAAVLLFEAARQRARRARVTPDAGS